MLFKLLCCLATFNKARLASNVSDLDNEELVRQRCHQERIRRKGGEEEVGVVAVIREYV